MGSKEYSRRQMLQAAGLAMAAPALTGNRSPGRENAFRSDGPKTIGDLGRTITENLGVALRGGPDQPLPPGAFLTWCRPGIPLTATDLDFAENGFLAAATAEGQRELRHHAFNFSTLLDYVPSVGATYTNEQQEMSYSNQGARLSELYGQILTAAKCVHNDLTADEQARLDRCRKFLMTTVKRQDLMTGEMVEQSEESPQVKAYNKAQREYNHARDVVGAKRTAAQSARGSDGLVAVNDWANNGDLYEDSVRIAEETWAAEGYRHEVDTARAIIDQVAGRDMSLWLQTLKQRYKQGLTKDIDTDATFAYTTLVPGDVATADGWEKFDHSHDAVNVSTHEDSTRWNAGGSAGFGLWSFGANASGGSDNASADRTCDSFRLSFEWTQAVIVRPWFYPEFFLSRGWTLKPGDGWNLDGMPSDGQDPPHGLVVGFPTQVILARNLVITSKEFAAAYSESRSNVSAGGSVGWGPFRISGGYSHSSHDTKLSVTQDGDTLTVDGMQIIGFLNHMIGKAPNPDPAIPASAYL